MMIEEELIEELVEMEVDSSCHEDSIEDYEVPLDFYLSCVTLDDYIGYLMSNYRLSKQEAIHAQKEVIKQIKQLN